MNSHTRHVIPLFAFVVFTCFLAAPAFAQTGGTVNPNGGYTIDIIQGIDTIENPSGEVLAVENDLAISSPLSPNEEQLIDDPNFMVFTSQVQLLSSGPPGASLSAYGTANLSSLIGYPDDNSVLNAVLAETAPSLLLTTQGNLATFPNVEQAGTEDFLYNAIFDDLTSNAPIAAGVVSSNITLDYGNEQILEDYTTPDNIVISADDQVNYDIYNIVEVTPETSSWLLLLAGLAGLGLFVSFHRRKAVS